MPLSSRGQDTRFSVWNRGSNPRSGTIRFAFRLLSAGQKLPHGRPSSQSNVLSKPTASRRLDVSDRRALKQAIQHSRGPPHQGDGFVQTRDTDREHDVGNGHQEGRGARFASFPDRSPAAAMPSVPSVPSARGRTPGRSEHCGRSAREGDPTSYWPQVRRPPPRRRA